MSRLFIRTLKRPYSPDISLMVSFCPVNMGLSVYIRNGLIIEPDIIVNILLNLMLLLLLLNLIIIEPDVIVIKLLNLMLLLLSLIIF